MLYAALVEDLCLHICDKRQKQFMFVCGRRSLMLTLKLGFKNLPATVCTGLVLVTMITAIFMFLFILELSKHGPSTS